MCALGAPPPRIYCALLYCLHCSVVGQVARLLVWFIADIRPVLGWLFRL